MHSIYISTLGFLLTKPVRKGFSGGASVRSVYPSEVELQCKDSQSLQSCRMNLINPSCTPMFTLSPCFLKVGDFDEVLLSEGNGGRGSSEMKEEGCKVKSAALKKFSSGNKK